MIKYAIWFKGTSYEHDGLCYQGKKVFLADTADEALNYMVVLQDNVVDSEKDCFSLAEIDIKGV